MQRDGGPWKGTSQVWCRQTPTPNNSGPQPGVAAAAEEETWPRGGAGCGAHWAPAAAPSTLRSLSRIFLPSCISGWFIKYAGNRKCWSTGKPFVCGTEATFPTAGKTMPARGSGPPAALRAAPPLTWEVACPSEGTEGPVQRSSGFPEMAQLQRAEATQIHPWGRDGRCLASPPHPRHCKRHSQRGQGVPGTGCPERAPGAAGRVRKACCPPTPALCWGNLPTTPKRWSLKPEKGWNGRPSLGSPQRPRDPRGRACRPYCQGSPQLPGASAPKQDGARPASPDARMQ